MSPDFDPLNPSHLDPSHADSNHSNSKPLSSASPNSASSNSASSNSASSNLASPAPLSSQLLFQLNWLLQLWATGAEPSPKVQAALVQLDAFQRWAAHHWSLQHPRLRAHQSVVDALGRRVGQQQFVVLVALLDAAAQIASNGHAEELAIALRYLTPTEQATLIQNLTRQWHHQPRWQRWLKLAQQVPGRTPSRSAGAWRRPSTDDIRSHLNALFDQPQPEIQALSLFLLHQLSLTEGLAQATHLLSHRVQLAPLLECVARAILNAAAEPVDLEDCSGLLQLLAADLEA